MFYLSAMVAMMKQRRATIVAMTAPPMLSVVSVGAASLGRAARPWAGAPTLVNWLQDLFPEVATALGMRVPRFVRRMRDWSLRRAKRNVVIGESMRAPNSVVIHNWADASLRPIDTPHDKFVVGYSGNLGRVHDVATMLGAMNRLRGNDVELLITGGGAKLDDVRAAGLPNVRFGPYAPRERLAEGLAAADA